MPRLFTVAIAVIAVVATFLIIDSFAEDGTEVSNPDPGNTVVTDAIFSGPTYDPVMGSVVVTSFDGTTITFTATPNDGYGWSHWQDSSGTVLTTSNSMIFDALSDRDAEAVFTVAGPRTVEIVWHMPVFGSDGSVVDGALMHYSIVLDDDAYNQSIADPSIQRHGTVTDMTPGALCTVDGAMASLVQHLDHATHGMTNLQKAIVVLQFVQDAVTYQLDMDQYGKEEFWATPIETLYTAHGDCEDSAVLYASLAKAIGIDVGFVMFDSNRMGTPNTGHLSVAIALKGSESVGGDCTTFELDDATWAYAETAFDLVDEGDYRPLVGVLSIDYSIHDASFTPVLFEDGSFRSGRTVYIDTGAASASGTMIYGGEFDNPPAVEMAVGDTFTYQPQTSLPATMVASGDGMAWLTWDSTTNTLSGTATAPGTWNVTLTATSTVGPVQTAVQNIVLIVKDTTGSSDHTLVYGSGGWAVEVTEPNEDPMLIEDYLVYGILGFFIVLAVVLMFGRIL